MFILYIFLSHLAFHLCMCAVFSQFRNSFVVMTFFVSFWILYIRFVLCFFFFFYISQFNKHNKKNQFPCDWEYFINLLCHTHLLCLTEHFLAPNWILRRKKKRAKKIDMFCLCVFVCTDSQYISHAHLKCVFVFLFHSFYSTNLI